MCWYLDLAPVAQHADDHKSIKTRAFGKNVFPGGFEGDFPGAVGELFPCPVDALLSLVPGQVGRLTCSRGSKPHSHGD